MVDDPDVPGGEQKVEVLPGGGAFFFQSDGNHDLAPLKVEVQASGTL